MKSATTIWLLGLSASGKSTLARKIESYIVSKGKKVQLLDGDVIRKEIGQIFGYKREERIKAANVYRGMSKLLNKNGINVIVAAISPYEEIRKANRENLENYVEVFINCPLEECIRRDPKGLYKRALQGKEKHVIGIDEEFEIPKNSDIEVNTHCENIEESYQKIINFLEENKVIL